MRGFFYDGDYTMVSKFPILISVSNPRGAVYQNLSKEYAVINATCAFA